MDMGLRVLASPRREKVCVFLDNSDVFCALEQLGKVRLDYKLLKSWIVNQREASIARFYCGEISQDTNNRTNFYTVLERAGYDLVLVKNHHSREKNAAHDPVIRGMCHKNMVWDICDSLHLGYYDTFILVTGSADFTQIVSRIRQRGVDVEVVFFENMCDSFLQATATKFRAINLEAVTLQERKLCLAKTRC